MTVVTISPDYRVAIPKEEADALGIRPGQEVVVNARDGVLELVPRRTIADLRGIVRGIDTTFERTEDGR